MCVTILEFQLYRNKYTNIFRNVCHVPRHDYNYFTYFLSLCMYVYMHICTYIHIYAVFIFLTCIISIMMFIAKLRVPTADHFGANLVSKMFSRVSKHWNRS